MKNILQLALQGFFALAISLAVYAEDEHGHDHAEKGHEHGSEEKKDKHEEEPHQESDDGHGHSEEPEGHEHKEEKGHDDHAEEEEENSVIGPEKGITEKSENGIKLSKEAFQTFEVKLQIMDSAILEIARKTLVEIKNDKYIYRVRDGWIKKIPVKVLSKNKQSLKVEVTQFKAGDQIIVQGVGFVRTADQVAEEGVADGHSH